MCAWGSELQDDRVSVRDRFCGAEGAGCPDCADLHPVDANAVPIMVDGPCELVGEDEEVGIGADHFEDRFLDAQSVAFAELGNLAEAPTAFRGLGVHVVGDQEFHSAHQPGQVGGKFTAEVACQKPGLDDGEQRCGNAPAQETVRVFALPGILPFAAQTAGNLTSRMDQIAVSRTTPSITLTRARAAAPARAGVAWPSNLTSIPAEESDDTATPVPTRGEDVPVVLPPAARLERRVQHMGIQDPGLLLEAHAIDRAAEALLRQATDDPAATSPPGPRSHRWRTDHQRGTGRGD